MAIVELQYRLPLQFVHHVQILTMALQTHTVMDVLPIHNLQRGVVFTMIKTSYPLISAALAVVELLKMRTQFQTQFQTQNLPQNLPQSLPQSQLQHLNPLQTLALTLISLPMALLLLILSVKVALNTTTNHCYADGSMMKTSNLTRCAALVEVGIVPTNQSQLQNLHQSQLQNQHQSQLQYLHQSLNQFRLMKHH